MKKITLLLAAFVCCHAVFTQNTFPSTGRAGIYTTTPSASLQVNGGARFGRAANGVNIDSATGILTFRGTGRYNVANNAYAFGSAFSQAGLFFNATDLRFDFRDTAGFPIFNVSARPGGNIGIGTITPVAKLDLLGNIKIADGTQGANKVLTSDATGLATWQNIPAATEVDPQVSSSASNQIPKWNGSSLSDGIITDNGSNVGIGTNVPLTSALLQVNSSNKGMLIPQISVDSLKDVTSIPSPANGLLVYNTTEPGVRNDMTRGYYYYSTFALSWIKLTDNFSDNVWQKGGAGIQLRNKSNGVDMQDDYTGATANFNPKVKILKLLDSVLLNSKNNITALTLTGVNRKPTAGWEFRQRTSIVFENNYITTAGLSGTANNVAISAYTENAGITNNSQANGLAFYVTAPPQDGGVTDTPTLAMFRHNVGIGAYPTDINNVTEGRLQITGFSNGDQLSLRHPGSLSLKWGLYVSSIDSSLNFYSNGALRANIDRVTGVYTAISDRNLKKNIKPLPPVLSVINKLTPYLYNYKDSKDGERKLIGFMAQDVEPYFPDLVFHTKDRETGEPFSMMTYQSFGVIAIKAIQEQQHQIQLKDSIVNALANDIKLQQDRLTVEERKSARLQEQIDAILIKLTEVQNAQNACCSTAAIQPVTNSNEQQVINNSTGISATAVLYQNQPNPFNQNTVIKYFIPEHINSAVIKITNTFGQEIRSLVITQKGNGQLSIAAGSLPAGSYYYTLFTDGKKADAKQMQIMR